MIYVITLLIVGFFSTGFVYMQNFHGIGVVQRAIWLAALLIFGCVFIYCGAIQIGAAVLTALPVTLAYIAYKNSRGW